MPPVSQAGTVVVLGITSYMPSAGVAWQTAQYLEGLRRLGYDVYYVEDHEYWPYDPVSQEHSDDCAGTVRFIADLMERVGLQDRWAYCDVASDGRVFGLSERRLQELMASADALVNLTASTVLREEPHGACRSASTSRPIRCCRRSRSPRATPFTHDLLSAHTHHFTYGENLGAPDCGVPVGRLRLPSDAPAGRARLVEPQSAGRTPTARVHDRRELGPVRQGRRVAGRAPTPGASTTSS